MVVKAMKYVHDWILKNFGKQNVVRKKHSKNSFKKQIQKKIFFQRSEIFLSSC